MPDRGTDANRLSSAAVPSMMRQRAGWPVWSAAALSCGLAVGSAHGQTISDTAREIETMVDFSGSATVDGDVVEHVDWTPSDDECTFGLTVRGTTDAGKVRTEFGTTLDFRNIQALRIKSSPWGPDVFWVTLRPKAQDFAISAQVTAEAGDNPVLADWKAILAAGEAAGDCSETSCTLTSTAAVATVIVMADADRDDAAPIERPFQILALLCEAAPQN